MSHTPKDLITVMVTVEANVSKAWESYTNPLHIVGWNFASDDWQCPWAKNDLKVGGLFSSRMEAKDRSQGFEFGGYYTIVETETMTKYIMGDPAKPAKTDRTAEVRFEKLGENQTKVTVVFEPETQNPPEMQQHGWQSILDNYKKYTERTSIRTIIIKASTAEVWKAFTTTELFENYMNGMKVVTNWKVNSPIIYTCYNKDGSVMQWEGMEMIWCGILTDFVPNKKLVIKYNGSAGLEKETYELAENVDHSTKLTFVQTAVDPATSNNYVEGNSQTLEMLKSYCE